MPLKVKNIFLCRLLGLNNSFRHECMGRIIVEEVLKLKGEKKEIPKTPMTAKPIPRGDKPPAVKEPPFHDLPTDPIGPARG